MGKPSAVNPRYQCLALEIPRYKIQSSINNWSFLNDCFLVIGASTARQWCLPAELKHPSKRRKRKKFYSPSSGERKGTSPNQSVRSTGMINDQFSMINKVRLWRTPPAAEFIENWNLKIENSTAVQWLVL